MTQLLNKAFDELTTTELFEIYRARTDVFVVEQDCAYPEVDADDLVSRHLWFAGEDGHVQAYCRLYPAAQAGHWHIGRVLVNERDRKQGLARELLQLALNWLQQQPEITVIDIAAQTYLTNFYASFGFQAVGEPFDDFGVMHQNMTMTLVK